MSSMEPITISEAMRKAGVHFRKSVKTTAVVMLTVNIALAALLSFSGTFAMGWFWRMEPISPALAAVIVELAVFATFSIYGLRLRLDKVFRQESAQLEVKARKLEAQRLANIKKQMTPAERALYEVQLENNKLLNDIKNKPSPQSSQWVRGVTYEIGDN